MQDFKGKKSLVIDYAIDVNSHEECQWYKEGGYLKNFKYKLCIASYGRKNQESIRLTGYNKRTMVCARYTEEEVLVSLERRVSDKKLSRRLLKKSGTSYR